MQCSEDARCQPSLPTPSSTYTAAPTRGAFSARATVVAARAAMVAREFDGFDDGYGDYGDGSEEVCWAMTRLITLMYARGLKQAGPLLR